MRKVTSIGYTDEQVNDFILAQPDERKIDWDGDSAINPTDCGCLFVQIGRHISEDAHVEAFLTYFKIYTEDGKPDLEVFMPKKFSDYWPVQLTDFSENDDESICTYGDVKKHLGITSCAEE